MKLALMSYTFSRQPPFDLARMCRLGKELGIDGVDVVTLHDRPAEEIRRVADEHGLRVVCHTFMGTPLAMGSAASRKEGLEATRQAMAAARVLGTGIAMLVTPGVPNQPREVTRRNYIGGLREAVKIAGDAGVILTIENFPGESSPFVTSDDVLEAIEAVPGLKLTFDNGNAFTGEDPVRSFERCARHVVHAHFKDWLEVSEGQGGTRMLNGRFYRSALIGEGGVDQAACLRAMGAAGYTGYINIEYEGNDYSPDEATRRAAACLRSAELDNRKVRCVS